MVTVEPYNPVWPELFRRQSMLLAIALGVQITAIEHIGSTAIPGLRAKPIIDIAARTARDVDAFSLEAAIGQLHVGQTTTHRRVTESRTGFAWFTSDNRMGQIRDLETEAVH